MQLCGLSKRSDLTDSRFQGSAVMCLESASKLQAVDSSNPKNQTVSKYITHRVSLLTRVGVGLFFGVCLLFVFLIIGYTLAVN